jgi:aminocarboxymuconate-semialdehyde decarboxylase
MTRPRTVDLHAHYLVGGVEALVKDDPRCKREHTLQAAQMGPASMQHNLSLLPQYAVALTDLDTRLYRMDAMGIDLQVVSLSPTQYHYWADEELAGEIVRTANEGVAAMCAARPDRFVGLGSVALQYPDLAAEQLTVAVRSLGLRGAILSTAVNGVDFSDPRFERFWGRAEELEALLFIHPLGCSLGERLNRFYLINVIGQPAETAVALSHLIFGGVLDRFPRLKICAAHGGGYLPYYVGRSDHAYEVRPESRTTQRRPSEYLRQLWFDSLVYRPDTLRHLIDVVGASQVVLGTDYPFDMGVEDPLDRLEAVQGLSAADAALIRGGTAATLLGLRAETRATV